MSLIRRGNLMCEPVVIEPISGYTCWFDAIDNQNTGTHSSSATSWVDRTGTYTVSNSAATMTWGQNYYYGGNTIGGEILYCSNGVTFGLGTNDCTVILIQNQDTGISGSTDYLFGESYYQNPGNYRWWLKYSESESGYSNGCVMFKQTPDNVSWQEQLVYDSGASVGSLAGKNLMICLTRSGSTLKMYVNGVEKASRTDYSYQIQSSDSKIQVGGTCNKVYSAMVYKKCLTVSEIQQMLRHASQYYNLTFEEI